MKKYYTISLFLLLMGIMTSCESNVVKNDMSEVPEILVDIMRLTPDEASKEIEERGYVASEGSYVKGNNITVGFETHDSQIVNIGWGNVTGGNITNTAFLWLNTAEVMDFELLGGATDQNSYTSLSALKTAMKNMKGSWELVAQLYNSKKGIFMEIQGVSDKYLYIGVGL